MVFGFGPRTNEVTGLWDPSGIPVGTWRVGGDIDKRGVVDTAPVAHTLVPAVCAFDPSRIANEPGDWLRHPLTPFGRPAL